MGVQPLIDDFGRLGFTDADSNESNFGSISDRNRCFFDITFGGTQWAAIEKLGQGCDLINALPASILVLRRHSDDFREAMIQNAMAGGDSATRGIFIGAVLGYMHGPDAIPAEWRTSLNQSIPGL